MVDMLTEQVIRIKEWNTVSGSLDPKDIKRMQEMLERVPINKFTAVKYLENDDSVTLSLNEIDLVENGADEQEAKMKLAKSILEYSFDYYKDLNLNFHSRNRGDHFPYVTKALKIENPEKIGDMIQCQDGKN